MPDDGHAFRACLRYWCANLTDGERATEHLAAEEDGAASTPFFRAPREQIWGGGVDPEVVQSLFDAERERCSTESLAGPIPVLAYPFLAARARKGGQRSAGSAYPSLIIPARLHADGTLDSGGGPVLIPRPMLRPWETLDRPQVGHVDDFDAFYARAQPPRPGEPWENLRAFAEELWQEVTGNPLAAGTALAGLSGFALQEEGLVGLDPGSGHGRPTRVFEALEAAADPVATAPLLAELCRLGRRKPSSAQELPPETRHVGQMRGDHPLDPSQRQALLALEGVEAGRFLTVTAAPGTGKRSLLEGVVATEMVSAALAGEEPPLILVASHDNRTVTSLLDALRGADNPPADHPYADSPLARRWLPELDSYGLYLASPGLEREAARSGHPFSHDLPFMRGSLRHWEDRGKVAQVAQSLLSHYEAWQGRRPEDDSLLDRLRRVRTDLYNTLRRLADNLGEVYEAWGELEKTRLKQGNAATEELAGWRHEVVSRLAGAEGRLERLEGGGEGGGGDATLARQADKQRQAVEKMRYLLGMLDRELNQRRRAEERWRTAVVKLARAAPEKADQPEWEDVDGAGIERDLDCNLRYPAFLVAARYWEADWAVTLLAAHEEGEELLGQEEAEARRRLRRLARLTPCLVGTFNSLPHQLDHAQGGGQRPLFGAADLLVVDDADHITPEAGAAGFALAQRALVVGDGQQVRARHHLPRGIDERNLRRAGLEEQAEQLANERRRAHNGDLLSVARHRTRYSAAQAAGAGMPLTEHRRCLDPIIAVSNRMAYGGQLLARRGRRGASPLPPLAYAHIHTHELRRIGSSPCNPGEAGVIARWVSSHRDRLLAAYPEADGNLARVLAIVTPFRAQARAIRSALRRARLPEAGPRAAGLLVGTARELRGADMPLVLFSATYHGSYRGTPYFDQGPQLLNTALTHAADSFLLFGDMRLFSPENQRPSGYLAEALLEGPDSGEITDLSFQPLFPVQEQEDAAAVLVQLANVADHRRALAEAFAEARRHLLLLTSSLTEAALEADRIPEQVARARRGGATVTVVTGRNSLAAGGAAPEEDAALSRLRAAGAEVRLLPRVHSNFVACDDRLILQGAFPWLGHPRAGETAPEPTPRSVRFSGRRAPEVADALWRSVREAEPLP